jgi:hypothetical protein
MARPQSGVRIAPETERGNSASGNQEWRHFGAERNSNASGSQVQRKEIPSSLRTPLNAPGQGDRPAPSEGAGWHRFSDRPAAQHESVAPRQPERSSADGGRGNNISRGEGPVRESSSGDWRHFTPQPRSEMQDSPERMNEGRMNEGRVIDNRGEGRFPGRGEMGGPGRESSGGYSRPPLDMRQPIVGPRAPEGGGPARGGSNPGGGYRPAPSGGGNQGASGGGNRGGSGGGQPHSPGHSSGPGRGR